MFLALFAVLVTAACRSSQVKRVIPGVNSGNFSELQENDLAAILVCTDSLGRSDSLLPMPVCSPCVPLVAMNDADAAVRHARQVWNRSSRAPYDSLKRSTSCVDLSYKYARAKRPDDHALLTEIVLFKLVSVHDSTRAEALGRLDRTLDSLTRAGFGMVARETLSQFAYGIWDLAQRRLERPTELPLDDVEKHTHRLDRDLPPFAQLPRIPSTSEEYGESEARWAALLFDRIATWTDDPRERGVWHRLTLAPLIVLGDWKAVDSTAIALLARSPRDSTVLPARALAAYRRMRRVVDEQPRVMALFDSALAAMPRADSLRYDSFDAVLTNTDDEWRYGFLPTERLAIDARGWAVLDPLWSTPVNELRLERRARVAEADYRYARIADEGEAGSETSAGRVFIRRGVIDARWTGRRTSAEFYTLTRGWADHRHAASLLYSPSLWVAFHHERFSAERLANTTVYATEGLCPAERSPGITMLTCAEARRADWTDVPFYGTTDSIDVTAARFRVGASVALRDSVDVYLGAQLPLRRFRYAEHHDITSRDRIELSAWFATPVGVMIRTLKESRKMPSVTERSWTAQWSARVSKGAVMHRVEAIEPTQPAGARGAAILTSDALVEFPLRGFGMSDVLVAASSRPRAALATRWRDLAIVPNGAVVAPRATFALAWEVYDLTPAPDGRVRWRVQIRREQGKSVQRADLRKVLVNERSAGARVLADEPDAAAVAYNRDAPAAFAVVDNLTFNLSDAPPGRHVVQVTITDLVSERSVTRSVSVRVLAPDAHRRSSR